MAKLRTSRLAVYRSALCAAVIGGAGCSNSHHGTAPDDAQVPMMGSEEDALAEDPRGQDAALAADAESAVDAQDATDAVDTGSAPSDACANDAVACTAPSAPKTPDCKAAPCTGEQRWRKQLLDVDDAKRPSLRISDVIADRGVFVFVEGGPGTRLDGVAVLEGAQFDPTTQRATAVVRIDPNGTLIDRRVLPPPSKPAANTDVRYFAAGHAESLVVIDEYVDLKRTRSFAWTQGTPGLSDYAYPEGAKQVALARERWSSFSLPSGAEPSRCPAGADVLTRFEHTDLSGQRWLSRACVRSGGILSSSLWVLPSGGLATVVSTYLEEGEPATKLRSDFGAGPVQLAANAAHLVVWNADGSPRFTRQLEGSFGTVVVGGDDDLWVIGLTARSEAPYRVFDRQGMLRGEGITPERSSYFSMHVDGAGHALLVGSGAPPPGRVLRKISGRGELLWERPIDPDSTSEVTTDAAGNIYLASQSGLLSQLAP